MMFQRSVTTGASAFRAGGEKEKKYNSDSTGLQFMAVAPLLLKEPPPPRGDQGAPFTHSCLPLLEHKTEKLCLPPQSHMNTSSLPASFAT